MPDKLLLETGDALLLEIGDDFLLEYDDVRWLPHHPDWIPAKPALRTSSQQAFVINISPIVNPPLPTAMPPMPTFPAQIFRKRLPRSAYQFTARGQQFLGFDLRNRVTYPDRFPPRRARQYAQVFQIGGVLDVPKTRGWRPRFPDRIPRRIPVRTGMIAYQADPSIFITSGTCVNWTDVDLVQPTFAAEDVRQSTFASEVVTQPTFGTEGVC